MSIVYFFYNRPILLSLVAATLMLGGAYGFEWAGYAPCQLCYYQRYPYMAAIVLAAIGLIGRKENSLLVIFLLAGAFELTGWIGLFHMGVEYGWWQGPASCSAYPSLDGDIEDVLARIDAAKTVRCDAVSWSLLGLSMPGYNFVIAMTLAGLIGWKGFTLWQKKDA